MRVRTTGHGQKLYLLCLPLLLLAFGAASDPSLPGQGRHPVCGNPTETCTTSFPFAPHDLPFVITGQIGFREYQSNFFYAVVLKSIKAEKEDGACVFIPEPERLQVQRQFPRNKVFTSHAGCPDNQILYDGVSPGYNFLAIFAGTTRSQAEKVLGQVKGQHPGANIRRLRVRREVT